MENNQTYEITVAGGNKRKIGWGVLLILCAVALLANKLGFLESFLAGISIWSIILSVLLAMFLVEGVCNRSFGQILLSLALLIIVNDEFLHLEAITPWPVLGAALLGTIGLNIIFPNFKKKPGMKFINNKNCTVDEERHDGDVVSYENCFGSSVKYLSGEISLVNIESSFGAFEVFFNDAVLKNNTARVNVEASFGEVKLHVPASWNVIISSETAFGKVAEAGRCDPASDQTLYVSGEASFGHLLISYH